MTRETVEQVSEDNKKRERLNRLLSKIQDLDSIQRRLCEAWRFESNKEEQEAYHKNRESFGSVREWELVSQIRHIH